MADEQDEIEGNGPLYDTAQRLVNPDGAGTDIAEVSSLLLTRDHYLQGDIVEGILHQDCAMTLGGSEEFMKERVRTLSISRLQQDYEHKRAASALQHLSNRSRVVLNADEALDPEHKEITWLPPDNFLDLLVVVANDPGFLAIIPNEASNHNYSFQLTLKEPQKPWTAKYGKLGFDPIRRMLFLGRVEGQQAWLAWVPNKFWDSDLDSPKPYTEDARDPNKTVLPRGRYRRSVIFMAALCSEAQVQGITCFEWHPELIDSDELYAWSVHTNIL